MTMQAEFEREESLCGRSVGARDEYGDYIGEAVQARWLVWQAAYAAGQRAERERVEALQAEESPFHQVLCTGEGCKECVRCERVAAAIRNRKEQP